MLYSRLSLVVAIAALLSGSKVGWISGRHSVKVERLPQQCIDKPPAEQATLERMIARQFSITPRDCWPGRLEAVAIEDVMPDYLYFRWLSLLKLFDQGAISVVVGHEDTDYYQHQLSLKGKVYAKKKVAAFWCTYCSIRARGFQEDLTQQPLILLKSDFMTVRVDGAHRSSILRHFGFKSLPAYVLRPVDLCNWPVEYEEQSAAVKWFLGQGTFY